MIHITFKTELKDLDKALNNLNEYDKLFISNLHILRGSLEDYLTDIANYIIDKNNLPYSKELEDVIIFVYTSDIKKPLPPLTIEEAMSNLCFKHYIS